MRTERAYLNDPFRWEFEAEIAEQEILADGRRGVWLPKTFFFPTGGGQEHDTGTLGEAQVVDVFTDENDNVIHVVDRAVESAKAIARIDGKRRFAFMQHHSAQHLLSGVIDHLLGLETVSSKISIDSPTTIDVPLSDHGEADFNRVENFANDLIYQDRAIKSYWITDEQVQATPFRRPPKVTGQIRVVEIDGFDYSACGGTHCTRTGMIGLVKILKLERRGDKLRVYCVAGVRAFEYFQNYYSIATRAAQFLSTSPENLVNVLERQQAVLKAAQKDSEELGAARLILEAQQLVANAEEVLAVRLITATFRNRPVQQMRSLAGLLQNESRVVALLANYDGTKATLIVTCGEATGISANELVRRQLSEINGRGGGDARLAQGGGNATEEQIQSVFAHTQDYIRALKGVVG